MKKAIGTMAAAGVVLLSSVFAGNTVHAETPSNLQDVQAERSAVQSNLSATENKIADVMVELKDLNKKITQVEKALNENKEKMNNTKEKMKESKKEIAAIEKEINELEKKIKKRYELMKERIKSYQKSGGDVSYLEVIFGSKSFGDMISRISAVSKIAESDEKLMNAQEADKAELEEKQAKVEEKLDGLKDMKKELEGMQETILSQKKQNEADKNELQRKQASLAELKAELKDKDSSLATVESEIKQRQAAVRQQQNEQTQAVQSSNNNQASSSSSKNDNGNITQLSSKKPNNTPNTASSGNISTAINAGMPYLGTPYVWGGKSPSGFDCSGFVSWAFRQAGISIPSSTSALQYTGTRVSSSNMQPGDLVFFNTYKTNGHVGIYIGNGKFIGSQDSGLGIANMTSGYWKNHFAGHVRRVR